MFQVAGGSIGLGLTTTVFTTASEDALQADLVGTRLSSREVDALHGALAGTDSANSLLTRFPAATADRLVELLREAFAAGMQWAFRLVALLALAGLIVSVLFVGGSLRGAVPSGGVGSCSGSAPGGDGRDPAERLDVAFGRRVDPDSAARVPTGGPRRRAPRRGAGGGLGGGAQGHQLLGVGHAPRGPTGGPPSRQAARGRRRPPAAAARRVEAGSRRRPARGRRAARRRPPRRRRAGSLAAWCRGAARRPCPARGAGWASARRRGTAAPRRGRGSAAPPPGRGRATRPPGRRRGWR